MMGSVGVKLVASDRPNASPNAGTGPLIPLSMRFMGLSSSIHVSVSILHVITAALSPHNTQVAVLGMLGVCAATALLLQLLMQMMFLLLMLLLLMLFADAVTADDDYDACTAQTAQLRTSASHEYINSNCNTPQMPPCPTSIFHPTQLCSHNHPLRDREMAVATLTMQCNGPTPLQIRAPTRPYSACHLSELSNV